MKHQEAIIKMIPPSSRRPASTSYGGIIQIRVTGLCDKFCRHCTQASNMRPNTVDIISPEQFEQVCMTLSDYFGLVAMFGGNPCLHPDFSSLCDIMAEHIHRDRRGLWANKLFGYAKKCKETFRGDRTNLNVHMDKQAYDEIKRDWPEANVFGLDQDSRHPPPFVAMQDVVPDEEERWDLIANCDINQNWSAMVCVFRGELRGFFCEVAGSQAMLHQHEDDYPDYGVPIVDGWWKKDIYHFENQIRYHCHACGIPLRGKGLLARMDKNPEQVSKTHADAIHLKGYYEKQLVESIDVIEPQSLKMSTKYLENAK